MQRAIITFLAIIMFICAAIDRVSACSCFNQPSPYQEFKNSSVVFVGLVKGVTEGQNTLVKGDNGEEWLRLDAKHTFHFVIEEPLKGLKKEQAERSVITGAG